MTSLPLGLSGFILVIYLLMSGNKAQIFLNQHAFIVVGLGSLAVLAISNPLSSLLGLGKTFRMIFRNNIGLKDLNQMLVDLAKNKTAKLALSHPLVEYAQSLWEQGLEPDTCLLLLKQKMDQMNQETSSSMAILRNLAKYPPALGMTGTVMGLVSLFSNLNPDAKGQIGSSLALAMTSTFYGLILANGILMPLADRVQVLHQEQVKRNKFIYQILGLIQEGQPQLVIREEIYGKSA